MSDPLGHAVRVQVALVLAPDDPRRIEGHERVEHLLLLGMQSLGGERLGGFHGHESESLEQVGDDHVAEGPRRVVEPRAVLHSEGLGDVDLDVADVLRAPHRFEQPVGEADRQDVLHVLLAQEVIDAEYLVLGEHRMQERVELLGRLQIGAEGFLEHHLGPGVGQGCLAQRRHDVGHRHGRHRQVVEHRRVATQVAPGSLDRERRGLRSRPRARS